MINASTGEQSVLPALGGEHDGAPPRRRRLVAWILGAILAALIATVVASALIRVPYYALSPGSVRPTAELISVDGATAYPSEGEIGFTTVSLTPTSALEAALGWFDPAVDVVPEDLILGDSSAEENRERNLEFMKDSKATAAAVALEALGYEVVNADGAAILEVEPDMPAAEILEVGDVVLAVNGVETVTWQALIDEIGRYAPGDEITVTIERFPDADGDGQVDADAEPVIEDATAVLAQHPEDPERPMLGVLGETRADLDFPFDVTIDSGDVGGPSAGLAFTIAILDTLTAEDLTGGNFIATTGTINLGGEVGPVGGVPQKTVAARRAGVDVFIVPSVEYDEALSYAGDMTVRKADTIEEAIDVLDSIGGNIQALAAEDGEHAFSD